jgi:glycosyltransferase involved in cell wall biosynthesis
MRIGLVTGEYPPMQGGVADFTREIGRAFVRHGHSIFVLTDRRGVGSDDSGITVDAGVVNWNRASLGAVGRWARRYRLDVVNLQYQTAAYGMAPLIHLLPRLTRSLPFVVTFHDLRFPYLFPKAGFLRDWWVLRLARDADAAIVTNAEDEARLREAGGVPRVARVPIGSNISPTLPEDFDRAVWRAQHDIQPNDILVAYFGFMNRSKGVDVLLRAAATASSMQTPLRIVMIGGPTGASDPTNAAYAEEIDALVARLGLTAADYCALPFRDGVSFRRGSLMAALAHGCAIVSTMPAIPLPEVVDGTHMRLVPPGDVESLARAMHELAVDAGLRDRLKAGASNLHARFSWELISERTLQLFDELRVVK